MLPDGLVSSSIPTILVSCKCDNPENTRQVNVESMEEECAACVEAVKTAANVPESARMCLSVVLRAIMAHRNSEFHTHLSCFLCSISCLLVCLTVNLLVRLSCLFPTSQTEILLPQSLIRQSTNHLLVSSNAVLSHVSRVESQALIPFKQIIYQSILEPADGLHHPQT